MMRRSAVAPLIARMRMSAIAVIVVRVAIVQ